MGAHATGAAGKFDKGNLGRIGMHGRNLDRVIGADIFAEQAARAGCGSGPIAHFSVAVVDQGQNVLGTEVHAGIAAAAGIGVDDRGKGEDGIAALQAVQGRCGGAFVAQGRGDRAQQGAAGGCGAILGPARPELQIGGAGLDDLDPGQAMGAGEGGEIPGHAGEVARGAFGAGVAIAGGDGDFADAGKRPGGEIAQPGAVDADRRRVAACGGMAGADRDQAAAIRDRLGRVQRDGAGRTDAGAGPATGTGPRIERDAAGFIGQGVMRAGGNAIGAAGQGRQAVDTGRAVDFWQGMGAIYQLSATPGI